VIRASCSACGRRFAFQPGHWIPRPLERLHAWETTGPFDGLPLEPRLAAVVIAVLRREAEYAEILARARERAGAPKK